MDQIVAHHPTSGIENLLRDTAVRVVRWRASRGEFEATPAAPTEILADLTALGILTAALPKRYGGLGLGTEPAGAPGLFHMLRLIGSGNLSVARLVEGHVNALHLVHRYGTDSQKAAAAADVISGHLFAIWNTEAPPGVRLGDDDRLSGRKIHCSAAGVATRAVITVDQERDRRMVAVALAAGERTGPMDGGLHGMRSTGAGWVDFTGYRPDAGSWIGVAGDYLREPAFSAGAWRTLAGLLGGLQALVEQIRVQLRERGRDGSPHQRRRIAEALVAQETAWLWVQKCAVLAETGEHNPADVVNYVNLARHAVETACLAAIHLAQRSLGLAAFIDTNPVERLMRDLATYLRQPATDEALDEAAAHFVARDLPRRNAPQ
jgi:alkylation response protein AidB-like acyl-CoA dehydrogenase